jgi:hypothetical protein
MESEGGDMDTVGAGSESDFVTSPILIEPWKGP